MWSARKSKGEKENSLKNKVNKEKNKKN